VARRVARDGMARIGNRNLELIGNRNLEVGKGKVRGKGGNGKGGMARVKKR
jgi:hypothetical protein